MKTRRCGVVALTVLLAFASLDAEVAGRRLHGPLTRILGAPTWTRFNINYLSTTVSALGLSDVNMAGVIQGMIYPKGSGKGVVWAASPIWGARVGTGGDNIRIGGADSWGTDLQPGRILDGMVPESPDLDKNRIYRVRPDIPPGARTADVSSEVKDGDGTADAIYDQYWKDWKEWPWQDGAPFEDSNGDGRYEPSIDTPGVPGADQTIWGVSHDIPAVQFSSGPFPINSPPIGIELQTTVWGYRNEGALGHMLFRSYLLINRNSIPFDSMYVSMWMDPDIGNGGDDLVGCDTMRSLGFIYNGEESDIAYSPLPPPALGIDFFQGPRVLGGPEDSAIFRRKRIYGKRNLPMTAFYANTNQSIDPDLVDPFETGDYDGAMKVYNALQGLVGQTGEPYVDPNTGLPTKFPFSGDPQKRTGWLDGTHGLTFGDRRMGIASGPFTMNPKDTQEIVVAEICAGAIPGCDRLSAVGLLKYYDDQAQAAYNNFFNVSRPPHPPKVAATALDQEIILSWGDDSASVAATELPAPRGYAFEGYNVYQLRSSSASLADARKVATFDVVDGVGKIVDRDFDPVQGTVLEKVMQVGTDSGIRRWLHITSDQLRNDNPLINGNPYCFAVTAYNYNSSGVPLTLESSPSILTVIPQAPNPGTRYAGHYGDSIAPVIHTTIPGLTPSDGTVLPLIIDPAKLTGHQYSVSFDTAEGKILWQLADLTTGQVKLSKQENQTGDQHYLAADGIQTIVSNPAVLGWKEWQVPQGACRFTWSGADGFRLVGFNGAMGNAADVHQNILDRPGFGVPPTRLKNVLLKLAPAKADGTFPQGDENVSYAYRYLRGAQNPPAKPEFAPFIKDPSGSYAFQDYLQGVPFSAWDVEATPRRRLAVAFLENNVADGRVDGKWWPDTAGVDNCATSGAREWFWILDAPYSGATPDPAFQTNVGTDPNIPLMWVSVANRRENVDWQTGDEFLILAYHINAPGNTFSFTAPANVVGDLALAKTDVSRINVFPNPYYGVNPQEINKYQRFVTFSHLPRRATIRIFNLAGVMVRMITHDSDDQFQKWDLKNDSGLPVGSGLYIAHIEMPDVGTTKILKIALVQEQQILDRY